MFWGSVLCGARGSLCVGSSVVYLRPRKVEKQRSRKHCSNGGNGSLANVLSWSEEGSTVVSQPEACKQNTRDTTTLPTWSQKYRAPATTYENAVYAARSRLHTLALRCTCSLGMWEGMCKFFFPQDIFDSIRKHSIYRRGCWGDAASRPLLHQELFSCL